MIKTYHDYIDALHEVFPKIGKKQLSRTIKIILNVIIKSVINGDDFNLSNDNFFLGIVTVRSKEEKNKYAIAKYLAYKNYKILRKNIKLNERKNKNNKHVQ